MVGRRLNAGVTIETSEGKKITINPMEVVLVEDTWGRGHRSVSENERFSVFIPITGPAHYRSVPPPPPAQKSKL